MRTPAKRFVLLLFMFRSISAQKREETYSFTMKEVLAFKNRIKELEQKDSLNTILIQKLENRIKMFKKELSESRTKNVRLLDENSLVSKKDENQPQIHVGIELIKAVMCQEVDGDIPMGINSTFQSGEKQIYCFSRLNNHYNSSSVIYHSWYYGAQKKAKVRIRIGNGKNQAGISKRIIPAAEAGQWHVEIVTADQKVLQIISFEVT